MSSNREHHEEQALRFCPANQRVARFPLCSRGQLKQPLMRIKKDLFALRIRHVVLHPILVKVAGIPLESNRLWPDRHLLPFKVYILYDTPVKDMIQSERGTGDEKSFARRKKWLPRLDSNQDAEIQSLVAYH